MDERTRPTQVAAAKALGVHVRGFRDWVKRDDWPFGRRGPFDIPAIMAWRVVVIGWQHDGRAPEPDIGAFEATMRKAKKRLPKPGEAVPSVIQAANQRYRLAQIRKLEFDCDVAAGKYIEKAASDAAYLWMMQVFHSKIRQWVGAMPEMFRGANRERIAKLAQDRYDRICCELQAIDRLSPTLVVSVCGGKDASKAKAASRRHGKRRGA